MNTIAKTVLLSTALVLPALSGNLYSHQQSGDNKDDSTMGGMMMGHQMMNMREQMQENHALMEKIMAENNTAKRDEMLQQHMQSMQEQMHMMNKTMGDHDVDGMTTKEMADRIDMMDMRMNMMQMMMEQMMDHQVLTE